MDRFLVRPAKAARIEKPLRDPRTLLSWNSNGLPVQMRKNWPEVPSAVFLIGCSSKRKHAFFSQRHARRVRTEDVGLIGIIFSGGIS